MRAFETTRSPIAALGAALAIAGCLGGCFLEGDKTAGVDDFPNSIYARVDGFLDENKKAETLEAAPGTDSLLIRQSLEGPPLPKMPAAGLPRLAKRSAGAPACPATGTVTPAKATEGSRVTMDTLFVCLDSLAFDPVLGNEHYVRWKRVTTDTLTGRVEMGELTDADGDGFLNPAPDGDTRTRLLFLIQDQGVTERTEIVVGHGPDDDLNTEADNLIYHLAWSRTRAAGSAGVDTLGAAVYADADSDGVVMDNARPSLVDVSWYAKGPTEDDKTAQWSRIKLRTWAVHGVKKTPPVRFSAESESGNGRLNRAVLLALDGGETFDLKDTVLARFQAVGTSPADTVDTLRTTIRMKVGDFDAKSDDTTYALNVLARKKLGEEVRAVFDFASDKPIPHGREPESGALTMRVEYADSTSLDVEGTITEKTVDLTATLRDGRRLHAVWDRSGKRLSLEYLD